MFQTVSARQIQRQYKSVIKKANQTNEPIVVMSHNQPLGAVIGLEQLKKLQLEQIANQALLESSQDKTKKIISVADLEADFEELEKHV